MKESASILAYLGLSGLIKLSVNYLWRNRRPDNLEKAGHVTALYLYPFKSAKGISFKEIQVSSQSGAYNGDIIDSQRDKLQGNPGLFSGAYNGDIIDRQWMVIKDGLAMTAREQPQLLKLEAKYESGNLVITAPNNQCITLDPKTVDKTGKYVTVGITYGLKAPANSLSGLDCGEETAQFLSDYLGSPGFRMLYCSLSKNQRKSKFQESLDTLPMVRPLFEEIDDSDMVTFQDVLSVSINTEESLADLNSRLDTPVPMERFRPTVIVSSGQEPYAEDFWNEVFIGDVRLKGIWMLERCFIPNIDTKTLKKDLFQPYNTIRSYRPVGSFGPCFGLILVVQRPGTIRVGDPIYVTKGPALTYISDK